MNARGWWGGGGAGENSAETPDGRDSAAVVVVGGGRSWLAELPQPGTTVGRCERVQQEGWAESAESAAAVGPGTPARCSRGSSAVEGAGSRPFLSSLAAYARLPHAPQS